jgi:hypothetical protein
MFVAVFGVGELLVGDGDLGGFALGGEVDGDERVGRGTFPSPSVDELARRLDETVGAEDGVDVAAFVSDGNAVFVVDAEIDAGFGGVVVGGGEPLAELVGVGPCLKDASGRCGIGAGDYERRGRCDGGLRHALFSCFLGFCGSVCSRNLPRLSSWFSQKTR